MSDDAIEKLLTNFAFIVTSYWRRFRRVITTTCGKQKEVTKAAAQQIRQYIRQYIETEIIGEDEKSKHARRFQCPNYGNGCYEWAEQWKMNSQPPFCSTDGKKMESVEFHEPDEDDWIRNELRAEQREKLREPME
jgi:hypothetical protein